MSEWRLFEEGTVPEWTTPEWYAGRDAAPHLEQEGHRERLLATADFLFSAMFTAQQKGITSEGYDVLDLGAGDGGLLSLANARLLGSDMMGFDLQQTNVDAAAQRGVTVELRDVVNSWPQPSDEPATVVVATEFLEHLIDPHEMVRRIHAFGAEYLVASSPYTESATSHYEFHTWAWDLEGYRKLLEDNGWKVTGQRTAWISQVLLAERA